MYVININQHTQTYNFGTGFSCVFIEVSGITIVFESVNLSNP